MASAGDGDRADRGYRSAADARSTISSRARRDGHSISPAYAALRCCGFAVAAFLIKPVALDASAALSKPNTAEYLLPIIWAITKLRLIPAPPIYFAIW